MDCRTGKYVKIWATHTLHPQRKHALIFLHITIVLQVTPILCVIQRTITVLLLKLLFVLQLAMTVLCLLHMERWRWPGQTSTDTHGTILHQFSNTKQKTKPQYVEEAKILKYFFLLTAAMGAGLALGIPPAEVVLSGAFS